MPSLFEYLFRWGGPPGILTLLFGLVALAAAAHFMWRPRVHRVRFITAIGVATLFMAASGVLSGVSLSLAGAASFGDTRPDWPLLVLQGLAESLAPAVSGTSLLALAALLVALGYRRMHVVDEVAAV